MTRFDVAIGSDLEIRIPLSHHASRRVERSSLARNDGRFAGVKNDERFFGARSNDLDFATQGRVVHVAASQSQGEKLVGVQFTGPRFQRLFRSESAG